MQACGSVCADIQNHCGEFIGNFQCERFVDETGSVFWSGQLFLKGVQTEAVVDTLIQNAAQLLIAFEDQKIGNSVFMGGDSGSKSGRTSADDDQIILFHKPDSSLVVPVSSSEPCPCLVTESGFMESSRSRISMTLGEQKPA